MNIIATTINQTFIVEVTKNELDSIAKEPDLIDLRESYLWKQYSYCIANRPGQLTRIFGQLMRKATFITGKYPVRIIKDGTIEDIFIDGSLKQLKQIADADEVQYISIKAKSQKVLKDYLISNGDWYDRP